VVVSSSVVVSSVVPSVEVSSILQSSGVEEVCSCAPLYTNLLFVKFLDTTVSMTYDGIDTPCSRFDQWLSDQTAACNENCEDCTSVPTGEYLCCDGEVDECKEIILVTGVCQTDCDTQNCCWIVGSDGQWEPDTSRGECDAGCECSTVGRPSPILPGFGWCTTCTPV